jgi:hypothetical protein
VRHIELFEESLYHGVLIFKLRRATTCSNANTEQVLAMLTSLRTHRRDPDEGMKKITIEAMVKTAQRESPGKWLLAGRLESLNPWTMKKILQCLGRDINPCRVSHRESMLGCIAEGVELAECQPQQCVALFVLELEWLSTHVSCTSSSSVTTTGGETSTVRLRPFMPALICSRRFCVDLICPIAGQSTDLCCFPRRHKNNANGSLSLH